MIGGLQVRGNLLCVTWSASRGHVFLYDLEERQRVSSWTTPVGPSGFSDAAGVAVDERYRVFVADPHNDCVRRYNAFGQHLGDLGLPPPPSGDSARDRQGVLDRPHAVAVWRDRVYVACGERPRRRGVQCFHVEGGSLRGLASRGDAGERFSAPRGLFCDDKGVVVADTLRGTLQCFRHGGAFVQELAVAGRGELARPISVARCADGSMLVVDRGGDRDRLVVVRADGTRADGGELGELCREPIAVATDARGRVYVLDHDGERVVRGTAELRFDEMLVDLAEHDLDTPHHEG